MIASSRILPEISPSLCRAGCYSPMIQGLDDGCISGLCEWFRGLVSGFFSCVPFISCDLLSNVLSVRLENCPRKHDRINAIDPLSFSVPLSDTNKSHVQNESLLHNPTKEAVGLEAYFTSSRALAGFTLGMTDLLKLAFGTNTNSWTSLQMKNLQ
eukprot:1319516-Amorphochlora_amoeboformis.AAC.2